MQLGSTEKEAIQAILDGTYTAKKNSEVKNTYAYVVVGISMGYVYASFTNKNKGMALLIGAASGYFLSKITKK